MKTNVRSIISHGPDGILVDIECHLSNSLPNIVIVGFASKTVDESKERLRGAFANAGLQLPTKRISINLAPADIPKDSSSLDVAIAVAILAAQSPLISLASLDKTSVFIGELALDGSIRPVRGIIGKLLSGRRDGIERFYIPAANMEQASLVPHIELVAIESLRDLYDHLAGSLDSPVQLTVVNTGDGHSVPVGDTTEAGFELHDIVGQKQAKRALTIAAAGGHNILLSGPPGTGKSMLAKAMVGLLPPLSHEETLEVTHLHSLAGRDYDKLVTTRPFRSPHHSASHVAVVGGGNAIRPGEVSLAHRGVLLFDEMPEFSRLTIESLRQPLEDRTITVSRVKESSQFPANFIFVATANPCPCGYFGVPRGRARTRRCQCSPYAIQHYRRKLSGPLLDRIDICVNVDHIEHDKLLEITQDTAKSEATKQQIAAVRRLQHHRYAAQKLNSDMSNRDIKQLSRLSPDAKALLITAGSSLELSARAYMRSLKVARTIADLAGSPTIEPKHITEALQFRTASLYGS